MLGGANASVCALCQYETPTKNLYSVYSNFLKVHFSAIRPFTKCLNFFKMVYLILMVQFRSTMFGGANASVCGLCQYETPRQKPVLSLF